MSWNFNPRSPQRERPCILPASGFVTFNFNPRSPQRERRGKTIVFAKVTEISIHAPRKGSDFITIVSTIQMKNFNPRSPQRERRPSDYICQSTGKNFNPRSPQRERPQASSISSVVIAISIHAPRKGSDCCALNIAVGDRLFQSTLPAKGAT